MTPYEKSSTKVTQKLCSLVLLLINCTCQRKHSKVGQRPIIIGGYIDPSVNKLWSYRYYQRLKWFDSLKKTPISNNAYLKKNRVSYKVFLRWVFFLDRHFMSWPKWLILCCNCIDTRNYKKSVYFLYVQSCIWP